MEVDQRRSSVELMAGATVEKIVSDLRKDGCSANLRLNEEAISDIRAFADKTSCYAYGNPKEGFKLKDKLSYEKVLNKDILLAKYFNFQDQEVFEDFRTSSLLRCIAQRYLGESTECVATQLWWTFPADVDDAVRSKAAHFFHRDVDAWGFIKFFFYLSDVGEGGGAHVYAKRTHKPSTIDQVFYEKLRINRHHDSSIIARFGIDSVTPFYGRAGTGIAADTFGFHKGESPEKNPRLMLCAVYANKDYGVQDFRVDPNSLEEGYIN
tara:strand:- start:5435 stop:6232 length:798 start_codon:yes stop_codon:yes gene_type:complete